MAKWIEIPILCNTNDTSTLRELNISVSEDQYDIRDGSINVDNIVGYYPTLDRKNTIISYSGTEFEVVLTYKQFKQLLR